MTGFILQHRSSTTHIIYIIMEMYSICTHLHHRHRICIPEVEEALTSLTNVDTTIPQRENTLLQVKDLYSKFNLSKSTKILALK